MNVLSLFDGMGCGAIALRELGINVDKYYASEIDKFAIMQTKHNFHGITHLGSVLNVNVSKLDHIDLLIGGSPCQSFSFAGKRKGMSTTENEEIYTLERYLQLKSEGFQFDGQSYLFWEYMRILTDIRKYNKNVKFLLENVEMGDKWERVLSEAIGIFGVHINSALVSAQNRKRIYWTNIRVKEFGLFGELHSDIPQPEDEGILLKDILEEEVDEKYYLSFNMLKNMKLWDDLGNGIIGHSGSGGQNGSIYNSENKMGSLCATDYKQPKQICIKQLPRGANKGGLFHDKCPTLTSNSFEHNNHVLQINTNFTDNYIQLDVGFDSDNRFYYEDGKHGTCLANGISKTGVAIKIKEATSKGYAEINPGECFDMEQQNSSTRRGMKMDDKSNSLMAQNMSFMNYTKDYRIRRLTPTECARLQTIPSWYKWIVSETQQYKMLGNGWTVKVIMHILKYINKDF